MSEQAISLPVKPNQMVDGLSLLRCLLGSKVGAKNESFIERDTIRSHRSQMMRLPAETYELRGSENIAGRLLYRGPEAVVALNSVFGTFINYWFPTSAASFLPHANMGL